jgi:hypothetical protein
MQSMQTFDLSSTQQPAEGVFRRLLWPRVANQQDVDRVGQQGFWVCVAVAAAWSVGAFFTAHVGLGLLIGATYFLGALGLRKHSVSAAVLMFLCLFLDRAASLEALWLGVPGGGDPRIGLVAMVLLLLNIRATILSQQWQSRMALTERGERAAGPAMPFADKLVNQIPGALWPRTRYFFYPLATLIVMTSLMAMLWLPEMSDKQQQSLKALRAGMSADPSR